jgi:hypothetical protein
LTRRRELVNVDLDDGDVRFLMQLALRARRDF